MGLEYKILNGIGQLVLNNPPKNSLENPVFDDPRKLEEFLGKKELKGVIFQGAGRHFCSGADLNALKKLQNNNKISTSDLDHGKQLLEIIAFSPVPVVAMIQGGCFGAGFEIAMACHFRIASQNALLSFPEVDLGLMPGLGGTIYTMESLPRKVVIDLVLSSRIIDADEALELGILDRVVPTKKLKEEAKNFLELLVGCRPAHIVQAVMKSIHNARRLSREEALKKESELFVSVARQSAEANRK